MSTQETTNENCLPKITDEDYIPPITLYSINCYLKELVNGYFEIIKEIKDTNIKKMQERVLNNTPKLLKLIGDIAENRKEDNIFDYEYYSESIYKILNNAFKIKINLQARNMQFQEHYHNYFNDNNINYQIQNLIEEYMFVFEDIYSFKNINGTNTKREVILKKIDETLIELIDKADYLECLTYGKNGVELMEEYFSMDGEESICRISYLALCLYIYTDILCGGFSRNRYDIDFGDIDDIPF